MKIINPPDKVIMQLTGSKVYDSKIKYRLLKWVGVIQVDEENESHLKIFGKPERGTILHNYITGETLYFEPEEDFRDYMERLVKGLFFVPYDHDDEKTVHQLRSALRLMNTKKDVTSFKILTTTDCNARCFYCYESGIKKHDMSLETADKVVEYIIKKSDPCVVRRRAVDEDRGDRQHLQQCQRSRYGIYFGHDQQRLSF